MGNPSTINADRLELDQINGLIAAAGVAGAEEILDAFWRSTEELFATLSAQLNDDARDLAANTAHAIKGSSANIGASRLAQTVSSLETSCRNNADPSELAQLLAETKEEFEAARETLLEHLRNCA